MQYYVCIWNLPLTQLEELMTLTKLLVYMA